MDEQNKTGEEIPAEEVKTEDIPQEDAAGSSPEEAQATEEKAPQEEKAKEPEKGKAEENGPAPDEVTEEMTETLAAEQHSQLKKKAKEDAKIKKKFKKLTWQTTLKLSLAFVTTILFLFFIYAVLGMNNYKTTIAEQNARDRTRLEEELTAGYIETQFNKLYELSERLKGAATQEDVVAVLSPYIDTTDFGNLNYYYDGAVYDANGNPVNSELDPAITAVVGSVRPRTTVRFTESIEGANCIGFYVPIAGSAVIDGLLSEIRDIEVVNVVPINFDSKSGTAFITTDGTVISSYTGSDTDYTFGSDFYTFLKNFSENKTFADDFRKNLMETGEYTVQLEMTNGQSFMILGSLVEAADDHYAIVSVIPAGAFLTEAYSYAYQIIVISIISIAMLVIIQVYFLFFYRQKTQELKKFSLINAEFNVPNQTAFIKEAEERISKSTDMSFAVLFIRMEQYDSYSSQFDKEMWGSVMQFLFKIVATGFRDTSVSTRKETYGYLDNGEIAVLMPLGGRDGELNTYMQLLNAVVNKNETLTRNHLTLTLRAGVYIISNSQRGKVSVHTAINLARKALDLDEKHHRKNVFIHVYSSETETILRNESMIEMKMESALASGDFKVFLQPKYNFAQDKLDSAEALVRWFDPDKGVYSYPNDFIYLFESNGFITKMDRFVYTEVCKYFEKAVERGEKTVPVSVNVSRVTAAQSDFAKFYIDTKRKHNVPGGLITIEFTESFAMENYELLADLSNQLHANGIQVSIDDFGSGYSSFNMLKNVNVDELKMDALFLKPGPDPERDKTIIKDVASLARDIKVKVVQEGVETEEQFNMLKAFGIDVLQGYYYAKAIPMEEYRLFVNSNTSIRFKAKVK